MKFEYSHQLSPEEARARLEALGEYLTNRHNIAVTWNGDAATFNGRFKKLVKIAGTMTYDEDKISFAGEDPGFPWRGQATKYIRGKLDVYLDPANPLDELRRK